MPADAWASATTILRLATELIDGIQRGVHEQGFADIRPIHGFAFARLSESAATTSQLADQLGITKQATSELVAYLVGRGYLTRAQHPTDRRASQLLLTERGRACTRAAQRAAVDTVAGFEARLSAQQRQHLHDVLGALVVPGRLRPSW